ncbi:MAG TPA: CHAD domain-containing protein [Gemmatimonas aurantiaca]|nr:CHAD domain-containing protein [Gemmatimonas aurantiaca]HCT58415.1 CHAD domain-containing protein [Gemmatimonas aurantiaca]
MPQPAETLTHEQVRGLIDGVLARPAQEGARILALLWLHQLVAARTAWQASTAATATDERPADGVVDTPSESAPLLHKARVSLRRLRATLRENARVLDGVADRRVLRALRRLGRETGEARDLDVHREWLDANLEVLSPEARAEAETLRDRMARKPDQSTQVIERAFARRLDPIAADLMTALGTYRLRLLVGVRPAPVSLARHLASVLKRSGDRLRRDLEHVRGMAESQDELHELRIRLKRQRAVLAPFAKTDRKIGAWFELATRGQDQLGAMRDAILLAERARRHKLPQLESALRDHAMSYYAAFAADWLQSDAPFAMLDATREALRAQSGPRDAASGLPLEIERKFLLRECPPAARATRPTLIDQGWLPGKALKERLRLRTEPDGMVSCWRTIKLGPVKSRIEVEEATSPELFASLWPLTRLSRVRKERYTIAEGDQHWEIDVFLDRQLVLAEVELESMEEPVSPPAWLAPYIVREVTGEAAYFNSELARPDV